MTLHRQIAIVAVLEVEKRKEMRHAGKITGQLSNVCGWAMNLVVMATQGGEVTKGV